MLKILVVLLLGVVAVQQLKIKMLEDKIDIIKDSAQKQGAAYEVYQKILAKGAIELNRELEDYKEAYKDCYEAYSTLFKEKKAILKKLHKTEQLHDHMVNHMHVLLKEGRVFRYKIGNRLIPYNKFAELTAEERYELFGV